MAHNNSSSLVPTEILSFVNNEVAIWVVLFILAVASVSYFAPSKKQRYANAPIYVEPGETIQQARNRFRHDAKSILQKAYTKHKGNPFYVPTLDGEKLMLPARYVEELKNSPDEFTDAAEPVFQAFESKYTLLASRQMLYRRCIRNHLYQNIDNIKEDLLDEVRASIADSVGACETWTDVPITNCMTTVVARVTSRMFGGIALSRNEAWVDAAVGSTNDGAVGALKLKVWPSILKPLIAPFTPEVARCKQHYKTSRDIIVPLLEKRQTLNASEKPNDFLQWMWDDAQGAEKDMAFIADMQLNVAFTGLFTSTAAVVQVLCDLCSRPEYIEPLREEILHVRELYPRLDRVAIGKLHKLDSFMKESQRFHPLLLITFTRWVWHDLPVLDLVIPKHTNIGVPSQAMTMDPEINENPLHFDGFRFSKLRSNADSDPAVAASCQWASSSLDNMAFGYGRVGCTGRQFASVEIKMILIEILMNYELGTPPGGRPASLCYDAQIMPNPEAKIPMKRRGSTSNL
ncbi:hypothetical protein E8E14_000533 [Neopestalotiopsis sp. 37M]|nr:hypothetical protein E8E14_000533 [Neopestalotiopsis sp. 37M]